jgi:hypothetical protein
VLATLGPAGLGVGQEPPRFLWGEGTPRFHVIPGGNPREALEQAAVGTNVPLWMGSFEHQGMTYPYTMVGTDPGAGSQTSMIPVVWPRW